MLKIFKTWIKQSLKMVVKGAGGESGVRNTKVGKDNNDRNDNIKVVVKVG